MREVSKLADHLAPDTVGRLERSAELRYDDGLVLLRSGRLLGALYFFGYTAEMCAVAAYFRASGFSAIRAIDRDTRVEHMVRARNLKGADGSVLMAGDPHPIVGWARYLEWKRLASKPSIRERQRLSDAITRAEIVYKHWRPQLRYMTIRANEDQAAEVRSAAAWFLEQRGKL